MTLYVAGRDKPHRCPRCWRCPWAHTPTWVWRAQKWLPRHCQFCGAWVLFTWPRKIWATRIGGPE